MRNLPSYSEKSIVTLEEMTKAIANRVGIEPHLAEKEASFVMDLFGFETRIIDNTLEQDDRQLFYFLEEVGLLRTGMEEATLYDGRSWRIHYWELDKEGIRDAIKRPRYRETSREPSPEEIYEEIPDELWFVRSYENS